VKVDGDVDLFAGALAHRRKAFGHILDKARCLDDAGRARASHAGLERQEAFHGLLAGACFGLLGRVSAAAAIDLDPVAQRAAHELVDGHAQRFAGQIPERMLHAG